MEFVWAVSVFFLAEIVFGFVFLDGTPSMVLPALVFVPNVFHEVFSLSMALGQLEPFQDKV